MAMLVRTNVGKTDPKKKKTTTVTTPGKTTEVTIKKATPAVPTPGGQTYKKADERTGAPSYGKESKTKPTPDFVKSAQDKKQTIVEKDGKKYRAGEHTELKVARQGTPSPSIKVKLTGLPTTKTVVTGKEVKGDEKKVVRKIKRGSGNTRKMGRVNYLQGQNPGKLSGFEGKRRGKKESGHGR
jgi:hypothetical protein